MPSFPGSKVSEKPRFDFARLAQSATDNTDNDREEDKIRTSSSETMKTSTWFPQRLPVYAHHHHQAPPSNFRSAKTFLSSVIVTLSYNSIFFSF